MATWFVCVVKACWVLNPQIILLLPLGEGWDEGIPLPNPLLKGEGIKTLRK